MNAGTIKAIGLLRQEGNKEADTILLVHKPLLSNLRSALLDLGHILVNMMISCFYYMRTYTTLLNMRSQVSQFLCFLQQHMGTKNGEDSGSRWACEGGWI